MCVSSYGSVNTFLNSQKYNKSILGSFNETNQCGFLQIRYFTEKYYTLASFALMLFTPSHLGE